jgi:hypothetical protein
MGKKVVFSLGSVSKEKQITKAVEPANKKTKG